jgi:hypothetical protein
VEVTYEEFALIAANKGLKAAWDALMGVLGYALIDDRGNSLVSAWNEVVE